VAVLRCPRRIGPLKPSIRSAFTVNGLPLPALIVGLLPVSDTLKSGVGRRIVSSYLKSSPEKPRTSVTRTK